MTQEDKQLLLVDLSARLPYGVKFTNIYGDIYKATSISWNKIEGYLDYNSHSYYFEDIKTYLFPLSSMTIEQRQKLDAIVGKKIYREINYHECIRQMIDFYHKYHLDYRGLIEKSLALDATGLNIY